ncbi:MAG TPA: hypothetical protein DEO86_22875 [Colwellia sp.]|nr:hypothetical protein [Colwellia sp.]|tara:strand:- start:215 stop:1429 length:1215 start_codon:yes stop_codon:yes gene_type:complete
MAIVNWDKYALSKLGEITSSKRIFKKEYVEKGVPFYRTKEVKELANGNEIATELFISEERFNEINEKFGSPKEGDILLTAIGTIGEIYVVKGHDKFYFKDGNVLWLKKFDSIEPYFLRYALISFIDELQQLSRGSTYNALPINKLKNYEIFVPPIPEQKRIVALLDTVFADLEQTRAKTEQNLKNARELFYSYLQQVFSQKGEGWVETTLGEISKVSYGYTEKASFDRNGPHFLRITDIQDGQVDWSKVPFCPISEADHEKHRLVSGDIVFARTGATTGKSYLLTSPPDSVAASYLIRLRLHSDSLSPKFIKFFFQTKEYWDVVNAGMSGSAQGGFNASKLSAMKIKYPESKNEQKKLIQKLTEIHQYVEQVNTIYKQKLDSIDELKKSILQKAFNGELTITVM